MALGTLACEPDGMDSCKVRHALTKHALSGWGRQNTDTDVVNIWTGVEREAISIRGNAVPSQ